MSEKPSLQSPLMQLQWFVNLPLEPVIDFYWRDDFAKTQDEDEFITSKHPNWGAWVAFIESHFSYKTIKDDVFIALILALNRVELPEPYRESLSQAIYKYLVNGTDLERAFFGFKQKLPFNTRLARHQKNRVYFHEMIMAQKVTTAKDNAKEALRSLISDRDADDLDNIYRSFLDWKKSEECMSFLDAWEYWRKKQKFTP